MNEPKKTADILTGSVKSGLKICLKLAELEKTWHRVVGSAAAKRSMPVSCEISEEKGLDLVIHADSPDVLPALRSRRTVIARSVGEFMGIDTINIAIKVGKVKRRSEAKEPEPAYLRRAPVPIIQEILDRNREELQGIAEDDELTESIARVKSLLERKNRRK